MLLDDENTAALTGAAGRLGAEGLGRAFGVAFVAVAFQRHRFTLCESQTRLYDFRRGIARRTIYGIKTHFSRNDLFWTGFDSGTPVHRRQSQICQLPSAAQ